MFVLPIHFFRKLVYVGQSDPGLPFLPFLQSKLTAHQVRDKLLVRPCIRLIMFFQRDLQLGDACLDTHELTEDRVPNAHL